MLAYGMKATPWSDTMMNTACMAATISPSYASHVVIGISLILDVLVYIANGLLVYKVS